MFSSSQRQKDAYSKKEDPIEVYNELAQSDTVREETMISDKNDKMLRVC